MQISLSLCCSACAASGLARLASVGGVSADVLPAALSAAVCVRLALDERSLLDRTRRHATRGATVHAGGALLLDAVEERTDEVHTQDRSLV